MKVFDRILTLVVLVASFVNACFSIVLSGNRVDNARFTAIYFLILWAAFYRDETDGARNP